jgi:hypothetical protein
MRKDVLQWLVPIVLAIILAGSLWFYWWKVNRPANDIMPEVSTEPSSATEEEPPAGPVHPLEETGEAAAEQPADLRPLPPLEESDQYFKMELADLFGESLDEKLVEDSLVERVVATIDNLPRERIADRIKPMSGISGQLLASEGDAEGEFVLSPENYQRYDTIVALVENADTADMEGLYRRYYPLLQKAYVNLGYPDGYFNDRVIEVIDHLLETPEVEGPVKLVRPHVLYEYADPELEELSPGQKLMLRMGNEHAAKLKEKLREFRGRIVATSDGAGD